MTQSYPNASLIRRLAALVYDFFLIMGLWFFTITLLTVYTTGSAPPETSIPEAPVLAAGWIQLICYAEAFLFNFYFWRFKGQTLGMQVWKIKVVNQEGEIISAAQACLRFAAASFSLLPFGLGFLWIRFTKNRLALHDLLSKTQIIYLGSKPYASEKMPEPPKDTTVTTVTEVKRDA